MNIGIRIKDLREQKKMSQAELASLIHTTKQTIFKYENGIVTNIPSDKIESMASVFNCSPAYLMGWEKPLSAESARFHARMNKDNQLHQLYFFWEQLTDTGKDKLIEYAADLSKIYSK